MANDGDCLYCVFRCYFKNKPKDMTAVNGKKVYRDECVELFIGGKSEYFELDVSPYNVSFYAIVENDGDPEPDFKEIENDDICITTQIHKDFYDVLYKIPLCELAVFPKLYFNAFRIEMIDGQRVSRSVFATDSTSHHVPDAFVRINLQNL